MKKLWLVLLATLVVLPFAAVPANAQVGIGVGVGPAVVDPGYYADYGPPDCEWGYYSYYPYACAPYGYYGPNWFYGGLFIGVGPWYHWGFYGHPGYYLRGGLWRLSRRIRLRSRRIRLRRTRLCWRAVMPAAAWLRGGGGRGYTGGGVAHGYSGGGGFSGGWRLPWWRWRRRFHGGGGGHGGGGHR
jgi:hypothetical protein